MARLMKKHPLLSMINGLVIDLPAPANISYLWNFGSLLGVCLVVQILTGIFLAMHYAAHVDLAFSSVEHMSPKKYNVFFKFHDMLEVPKVL